jgi:cold shock CspA family protein
VRGKINHWLEHRGFGFIRPDDATSDVFVHVRALKRRGVDPAKGDEVEFEVETDRDGRTRAVNVQILNDDAARALPISYGG